MSGSQVLTIALSTVPTCLVVLVGLLIYNSHLNRLRNQMDALFSDTMRLMDEERRSNDANFKLILSKIEDIDSRLTRLEERFAR